VVFSARRCPVVCAVATFHAIQSIATNQCSRCCGTHRGALATTVQTRRFESSFLDWRPGGTSQGIREIVARVAVGRKWRGERVLFIRRRVGPALRAGRVLVVWCNGAITGFSHVVSERPTEPCESSRLIHTLKPAVSSQA
jgi:hypothetical protein